MKTDTDIAADLHEIDGGEKIRLRQTAQNIVLPHYGGLAISRISTGYEPENAGTSEDSQNKCIFNLIVALLGKCYMVEVETRQESTKRASSSVLPAAPPSQFHVGTEVTNHLMLDAVIAYPPPSKPRYVLMSGLFAKHHESGATLHSRRVLWTWRL